LTKAANLKELESHFAFGENWAAYAEKIGTEQIDEAIKGLDRLAGARLHGKRFLDIGCGSGLHGLAALRLGAAEAVCVDIDPDSVATAKRVLARHAAGSVFRIEQASVFDMNAGTWGQFDVVYSWGVLHHTGDMYGALRAAAQLVKPGGTFIFALYRKTWLCRFWRWEKQWYARASARRQEIASAIFVRLFALGLLLQRRSFKSYVGQYRSSRGMDYFHDVHDWLGGYPYESISPEETERFLNPLGFHLERSFVRKGVLLGRCSGVFGSGCDEYVYTRN